MTTKPQTKSNAQRVAGDNIEGHEAAWIATENHTAANALEASNRRGQDALTAPGVAPCADTKDGAPVAPARANLRQAAQAVLDAWNGGGNRETDIAAALEGPMASLQAALAGRVPRAVTGAARKPREGTKQEAVLALLRRPEGVSGPQIAEATGWASHTVRGFLAGLKKKGFAVETLERVRQIGPDKQGANGSYTVYRIGGPD